MGKKANVHVTYKNGDWNVRKENADRASKTFNKKETAVNYATKISKNDKVELLIHNKDGKISEKNSYGNDPCPPKDKK